MSVLPINFPVVIEEVCDGQKKDTSIIPIFKKAEKEDPGNSKLSSLTWVFWKIFLPGNHFRAQGLQKSD